MKMKSFVMASFCVAALSMGAVVPQGRTVVSGRMMPEKSESRSRSEITVPCRTQCGAVKKDLKMKSLRKVDAGASIEGDWAVQYWDAVYENSTDSYFTVDYVCTYDEKYDLYWFDDPTNQNPFFGMEYSAEEGVVNLPSLFISSTSKYLIAQNPFYYDFGEEDFIYPEDFYMSYDSSTGLIDFGVYAGIIWTMHDPDTREYVNDYDGYYVLECAQGGDFGGNMSQDGEWTNLGNAVFMDGWVLPGLGIDQTDEANWYEVPLQRYKKDPNIFRLVDPYHTGPAAQFNESRDEGQIMFDVSDPDHVVFLFADAAFANTKLGLTSFYCYNTLGALKIYFPEYTTAQLVEKLGPDAPYTTFKDGVVSLTYGYDEEDIEYDANFGQQYDPYGGYQWPDDEGNFKDMSATIYFPENWNSGVEAIGVDDDTEPVFYNLQGIRISEPRNGQIIIVNGKKVVKTLSH